MVGDEGGGIRIFDLAGGHPVIERCLPSLERGWPFYESLNKRKSYRTILALALSDDEPPWLTTVHRGGVNIGGGFILRRSLGGEGPPYPVLPDQKSGQRRGGGQEPRPQSDNPSGEEYLSAYFEPNGRRLVTGGAQGAVMLWDLYEPKFQKKIALDPFDEREEGPDTWDGFVVPFQFLRGMTGAVRAVLYTTAGLSGDSDAARNPKARAVVGLDSGAGLRIWDIGFQFKNYLSEDWAGTGYSYALTFHPVFGLITTSNRGKIRTWHIEGAPLSADTGDYAKDLAGKERPLSIRAMDVKDSLMVLGLGDNTAQLLDLANPAFGHTLAGEDGKPVHTAGLWSVRFRPGNGRFGTRFDLATGDYAGKVAFWDLVDNPGGGTTGAVSGSCQFQGRIGELSFHPRGRWLIAGTAIDSDRSMGEPYGELHLVDMEGRACKPSESVACSGGPCVAVTLGQGGKPSSNALTTLTLVRGVAFSKDGTKLAVSGDYGMLRWWNFQEDVGFTTGDPGMALDGARGRVNAVEFVPGDDYKLAAVGQDGFLRIWSLAENENANPLVLKQAGTELHGLAVNQDGRYIAAGDARGRFHLWDLDVNRYICRAVLRNLTWHEWLLAVRDDEKYQVICPNRVPNREIPAGIPPGVEIKKN